MITFVWLDDFCFVLFFIILAFYWKRYKGENATDMVPSVSLNLYSLVKHVIYIQFFRNFREEKSKTMEIIRWNEWGKGARSHFIFWTRRYDVAPKGAPWQMCPTLFGTNIVRVHLQDLEAATLWNYGIQGQGQQLLQWETWQDVTLCPSCTWSRQPRWHCAIRKQGILRISQQRQFYQTKKNEWFQGNY